MPSRDIKDCEALLQEFWPKLERWYIQKYGGKYLFLTCTARSVEEQQAIFAKNAPGSILTRCDGVKNKSKHNYEPAQAFDVAVSDGKQTLWQEEFYIGLGSAIKDIGYEGRIRWGGWFSFRDYPHFEVI
jgi:hypothetical protein